MNTIINIVGYIGGTLVICLILSIPITLFVGWLCRKGVMRLQIKGADDPTTLLLYITIGLAVVLIILDQLDLFDLNRLASFFV